MDDLRHPDAFHATPPRRAPVAPGYTVIRGLTSDGFPIAARLPEGSPEADRLTREVEERSRRMTDRRRLVAIIDDPTHHAERTDLISRLSRPTWPLNDR